MESESCGMRGKEGGWDEWKTIDAATATVDVEDTWMTQHPEYSTAAQFPGFTPDDFGHFAHSPYKP